MDLVEKGVDWMVLTEEERRMIRELSKEDFRLWSSIHAGGDYSWVDFLIVPAIVVLIIVYYLWCR
jgi:hypothetical protein